MKEEELISVNLWLGGRNYRIRIKPEEEEAIRKAVKIADAKVGEMRTTYAGQDEQDFLAMTLLMYAADSAVDVLNNPLLKTELSDIVRRIDRQLGGSDD